MSRHDVCKKPDHERERLRYQSEQFYRLHYRQRKFQEQRNIRPQNLLPIMLVSKYIDRQEGAQGQNHRHGYVSRNIRSARKERHYSQEVAQEYEEEHSQQVRRISAVFLFPYGLLYQVIIDHHYHHLHQSGYAFRSAFLHCIMLSVPPCRAQHKGNQQQSSKHQRCDILCY